MYYSAERETTLVSAELSSFKSIEKDWQSQLVTNFIDQVHNGMYIELRCQYMYIYVSN